MKFLYFLIFQLLLCVYLDASANIDLINSKYRIELTMYSKTELENKVTSDFYRLIVYQHENGEKEANLSYDESHRVLGGKGVEVFEEKYSKSGSLPITIIDGLIKKLLILGIENLSEHRPIFKGDFFGNINIAIHGRSKISKTVYRDRDELDLKIWESVFEFIEEHEIFEPSEKIELSIQLGPVIESYSFLHLIVSEIPNELSWIVGRDVIERKLYESQEGLKGCLLTIGNEVKSRQIKGIFSYQEPRYTNREIPPATTINWATTNPSRIKSQGDDQPVIETSLEELLKDRDYYNGKRVRVTGYFSDVFEGQNLENSGNNVWLGEVSYFANKRTKKVGGWCTVDGVFFKGPSGHFGCWGGEITRITKFKSHLQTKVIIIATGVIVTLFLSLFGYLSFSAVIKIKTNSNKC